MSVGNTALKHGLKLPNTLKTMIQDTAALFGGTPDGGVRRLALDAHDLAIKEWFAAEAALVGCKVMMDTMGNQFAIFPGKVNGVAPTAIGSHLDTQPTGGRYDGILGVLSGLEVLKTLHLNQYVPEYPLAVVNWMNEEGARFPMSMMSSSVWAGHKSEQDAGAITDSQGVSVDEALRVLWPQADVACGFSAMPLAAHFELHIEQGPVLEAERLQIGLVQGIQAYKWLEITIDGRAQHTGTTPMDRRNDAMLAMARFIMRTTEIAVAEGGLASVGQLYGVAPGAVNVIPERVQFSLDVRHADDAKLARIMERVAAETPAHSAKLLFDSPAVKFDATAKRCVADAAAVLGFSSTPITSGAGHDSGPVASRCPTAMIFVPSKDGISHNPAEYTSPEEFFRGYEVLLEAVLRFDRQRTE